MAAIQQGWFGALKPAGGGGGLPVHDPFTGTDGSPGANWTVNAGDADRVSDELAFITPDFGLIHLTHATPVSGLSGFAKYTLKEGGGSSNKFPGVVFRYTNSSSPYYTAQVACDGNYFWSRYASVGGVETQIATGSLGSSIADDDSVGVTWTGTGTGTIVRIWKNPSGNAPSNLSTWGGASATVELTDDPASPVDSGTTVGLTCVQNTGLGNTVIDDFRFGDAS